MNEQQIRAIVQQEVQAYASSKRFGLTTIPRHIHNGIDSPLAYQPIVTYVGIINDDGTALLLPKNWSVAHSLTTGYYVVTHNLAPNPLADASTTFYSVSAVPISRATVAIITSKCDPTTAGFTVCDLSGAALDNGFYFILTVVNNKVSVAPQYTGTNNIP